MDHPGDFNTFRTTDAEKRAMDRANEELYETLRCASEVHREVRPSRCPALRAGRPQALSLG